MGFAQKREEVMTEINKKRANLQLSRALGVAKVMSLTQKTTSPPTPNPVSQKIGLIVLQAFFSLCRAALLPYFFAHHEQLEEIKMCTFIIRVKLKQLVN